MLGVDFDGLGGDSPVNWNSYLGGDTQIVLNNLISEAGQHVPYQLTVSTSGSAFVGVASTAPLDPADVPIHTPGARRSGRLLRRGRRNSDIHLEQPRSQDGLPSLRVRSLERSREEQRDRHRGRMERRPANLQFHAGHFCRRPRNQRRPSANQDLSSFSLIVISDEAGEIVIQVTNEEGFEAGIAGLAIAPTKVGSIEGEKWNDVNGNQTKDASEQGLPGWVVYLDLNNDGILNSTSDKSVVAEAGDLPQALPDYATKKSELLFTEVGQIVDIDVTIEPFTRTTRT